MKPRFSNVPEGATHWSDADRNVSRLEAFWRPSINGDRGYDCWAITEHCEPYWQQNRASLPLYAIEIEKPWSGEGLPPVGTVCEINHRDLNWVQCEIVAHKHMGCGGHTHAIAWIDGNTLDQSQGLRFRPIRTQEQIASDEREAKAKSMWQQIYFNTDPDYWDHAPKGTRDTFIAAIDAGWQKKSDQ